MTAPGHRPLRGGPQRIPRPEGWQPGAPAPWTDRGDIDVSLPAIETALAGRTPTVHGDPATARRSAVLVPLYESDGRTWLVLTRRSPAMRTHTREISFPGGAQDRTDADTWETALREAREEIGLDASLPRRIGALDPFVTVGSRSLVHPIVAALPGSPVLRPSEDEVEHVIHVPLDELFDPTIFREEIWTLEGRPRPVTFFELVGDTLWGATGSMVRQLLSIIAGIDDPLRR